VGGEGCVLFNDPNRRTTTVENSPREETLKIRSVVALVGSAISFAVPAFAQQTSAPDPQLRQALDALDKKNDEAFNNGDASSPAALYTEDAVEVTDQGPIYGRQAIEKHDADLFQKVHFSDYIVKADQYSPHNIGTDDNAAWSSGEWSATIQGQNFGSIQLKGFWSAPKAHEGDVWKTRMLTWNISPPPAMTPSPTASPTSQ
jgi:ketosteroid isomerase-like protein